MHVDSPNMCLGARRPTYSIQVIEKELDIVGTISMSWCFVKRGTEVANGSEPTLRAG